jgi:hypothetical protein
MTEVSGQQLAALRQQGGAQHDPTGFFYLETLARRTQAQQGTLRQMLETKLALALAEFRARSENQTAVESCPAAQGGREAGRQAALLAGLNQSLAAHAAGSQADVRTDGTEDWQAASDRDRDICDELKSIRYFRSTWSKLSAERHLAALLKQGPENAGPLNSHSLVLRSLVLMRDLAPDYLARFLTYADALLWLEQVEHNKPAPRKPPRRKRGA